MDKDDYVKTRVEDQIRWYGDKSSRNKTYYLTFRIIEISLAVSIPLIVGSFQDFVWSGRIVAFFGVLIAVLTSISSLFRFQEKWLEYRNTSESIKHEKFLFVYQAGLYTGGNNFNLFVEKVESLISQENNTWYQNMNKIIEVPANEKK